LRLIEQSVAAQPCPRINAKGEKVA
jgi:hypothetical protein